MPELTPGQVDHGNLAYFYLGEQTSDGLYYKLILVEAGPETALTPTNFTHMRGK